MRGAMGQLSLRFQDILIYMAAKDGVFSFFQWENYETWNLTEYIEKIPTVIVVIENN